VKFTLPTNRFRSPLVIASNAARIFGDIALQQILGPVAENLAQRRVDQLQRAGEVNDGNADRGGVEHRAESGLAGLALPLRDVPGAEHRALDHLLPVEQPVAQRFHVAAGQRADQRGHPGVHLVVEAEAERLGQVCADHAQRVVQRARAGEVLADQPDADRGRGRRIELRRGQQFGQFIAERQQQRDDVAVL
jgi:hypothetical protein